MKTIKVKETKTYNPLNEKGGDTSTTDKIVAEAKLVLVEYKYEEALISKYWDNEGKEYVTLTTLIKYINLYKHYKPILISETEKIEAGDWAMAKKSKGLRFVTKLSGFTNKFEDDGVVSKQTPSPSCYINNYYKVLALPEHFSHKLLQDIVDGKLKEGDSLLVECEETNETETIASSGGFSLKVPVNLGYQIKLNSSGHITLHKLEEKKYSREEVYRIIQDYGTYINCKYDHNKPVLGPLKEWFEQNVK